MKIHFLAVCLCISLSIKAQTDVPVDVPGVGYGATSSSSTFRFDHLGKPVAHYGLGWYSENGTPSAYLSGYAGLKFFTGGGVKMMVGGDGNVGIGTTSPGAKLSFNNLNDNTNGPDGITWYNPSPLEYGIHRTAGTWVAPNYQQLRLSWDTGIILDPGSSYGKSYVDVQGTGGLRITSGNVGIGTIDTKGYKLAVAGNMVAESVKVSIQANWPDYVFTKDYQLPTLQETEKHIKDKGHLPGIPSAAEVKANGVDLGEMNAKLLQKIEELTLHLIRQQKEIEQLKNRK